jgi:hypothetical protein
LIATSRLYWCRRASLRAGFPRRMICLAVIKISRARNRLIAFGARGEHLINFRGCSTVNRVLLLPTNTNC